MKYLQYIEPDEHDNVKVIRVTVEQAIEFMNQIAAEHGHVYDNADEAVNDFIAVNWAYWVEE
jgi:histidinol dehydrogenase